MKIPIDLLKNLLFADSLTVLVQVKTNEHEIIVEDMVNPDWDRTNQTPEYITGKETVPEKRAFGVVVFAKGKEETAACLSEVLELFKPQAA